MQASGECRVGEIHPAVETLIKNGTGRVLGAYLLGPESSELVKIFVLAIRSGLKLRHLKNFVSPYPSAGSDIGYLI